jgi:SpoVK/Ycf46/Vps4 family AAA+-type ATPase
MMNIGQNDIVSTSPLLFRMGGHERMVVNTEPYPAGFLELSILPPPEHEDDFSPSAAAAAAADSSLIVNSISQVANLLHSTNFAPSNNTKTFSFTGAAHESLVADFIVKNETRLFSKDFDSAQLRNEETVYPDGIRSIPGPTYYSMEEPLKAKNSYDIYDNMTQRIGGLSKEIKDIIRRVLLTRKLPPSTLSALGLSHVRGILLYGAPGNGKTLIAREIARVLKARKPKIVNGPEIFDKFVGEAEKNVRELFEDAEAEWERVGVRSELHVIILDEFDAIAKKRGTLVGDGSGARDSVVNQLLSKIDGVAEMSNVLLIALTNRKDLIDPALLRPGRLEVHIEIRPPSEEGRREILQLLFQPIIKEGVMSQTEGDEWMQNIVPRTEGWSGADLTGLIRSAASFAIERSFGGELLGLGIDADLETGTASAAPPTVKASPNAGINSGSNQLYLTWNDFDLAFGEVVASMNPSQTTEKVSKRRSAMGKVGRIVSAPVRWLRGR